EVARVQRLQPLLVPGVQIGTAAGGEGFRFPGVDLTGGPATVLPAVDESGQLSRRPALLVEVGRLDELLEDAQLVVGVEDGEVGLEADELGVAAQHPGSDRMEGAEPGHALKRAAGQRRDSLAHFPRRLVREGDGQDLARPRLSSRDQVGEPSGQRGGLASACAGQHEQRSFSGENGFALRWVEAPQIGWVVDRDGGFRHGSEVGGGERNGNRRGADWANLKRFRQLCPISPLYTGSTPHFSLSRLGGEAHGAWVIGTAVPASPGAGNGKRMRQVTKGPISAGRIGSSHKVQTGPAWKRRRKSCLPQARSGAWRFPVRRWEKHVAKEG